MTIVLYANVECINLKSFESLMCTCIGGWGDRPSNPQPGNRFRFRVGRAGGRGEAARDPSLAREVCDKNVLRSFAVLRWPELSRGCPAVVQRLSSGCPAVVQWLFRGCPVLARGCPAVVQRLSRGCPVVVSWLSRAGPWLSRGCPVVVPWLPRGCPVVVPWYIKR